MSTSSISRRRRAIDSVAIPTGTPPEQVEVLVVGAGPTGLGAALELTRHGVEVAMVDQATSAALVRAGAVGYSPRAVEIIRGWDLVQRVKDAWTVPPEWNRGNLLVTSVAGHVLEGGEPRLFSKQGGNPFSKEDALRRPQTVLQKVFLERLGELRVSVTGGWRVESLVQDGTGVTTTVVDVESGTRRSIRSSYVVGADGGNSTVRRLAGITRSGEYATERYYRFVVRTIGDVSGALGHTPSASNIVVNQGYSGFISALNETDWRAYAGPYPLDVEPTSEELIALARTGFGFDVELEVLTATPYFKSTRIADQFVAGRVALVGDAAHVRTPGGNLCEGLGDAANLGWKLAAVLRGEGGAALLQSYDEERRPHNWRVADHALERSRALDAAVRAIREIGVPDDVDLSTEAVAKREQMSALLGEGAGFAPGVIFDERYDASSVIWYDERQFDLDSAWDASIYVNDPRPGHRAPDGALEVGGVSLYGRLDSHLALLVLTHDSDAVAGFVEAAAERSIDLDVIHLAGGEAHDLYRSDYVLVRPDHHVAWRGDGPTHDAGTILDHVYGRVSEIARADSRLETAAR